MSKKFSGSDSSISFSHAGHAVDANIESIIQHSFPAEPIIQQPLLTFVIPALNEEITVGEFVDWCKEGLATANVSGQILIVNSSTDKTAGIALAHGAEVLTVPKRGLGRAYIDAIPYIRGQFVLMGDADLTYDTRHITDFIEKFKAGYEFVMGSRFKGSIEKGAMPALHRYFGTPLTTYILNKVYGCRFSDIHCGMRGVTLDALKRMNLQSQSWQYASEMIIKAIHLNLNHTEVPVIFHKDRDGRVSHHKRVGWYAPWLAGWINVKAIFTFGADFFLYKVGLVMGLFGALGTLGLYNGPWEIGKITFSIHWMLFFLLTFLVGMQFSFMGVLAKALYDSERKRLKKWTRFFSLDVAMPVCSLIFVTGILTMTPLIKEYIQANFQLWSMNPNSYHAVFGFGLVLFSVIYFTSALLFNAIVLGHNRSVTLS